MSLDERVFDAEYNPAQQQLLIILGAMDLFEEIKQNEGLLILDPFERARMAARLQMRILLCREPVAPSTLVNLRLDLMGMWEHIRNITLRE